MWRHPVHVSLGKGPHPGVVVGELVVDGEPRPDGVGRDLHLVAEPEELQRRLGHADVRL